MSKISTTLQTPIPCPKCGHTVKKRLSELKADTEFPCPGCGAVFRVSGGEFETVGKSMDDLQKTIAKLGRKR